MNTRIETLSEWIAGFHLNDAPERVTEMARLEVLDCLASICAGYRSVAGRKIYRALEAFSGGEGIYTILPTGEKWPLENTIYLHSALINTLELDNFSYMGHLSESAFPVALAIAEKTGASDQDFLESFICAQEVSGRMGAYMASGRLQGHMRSFLHRIAAAVATVKLYRCPPDIIAHAISIALSSPEMPMFPASFSPDTKITCVSSATVEGVRSAFLAMQGFEGTRDIIEHPAGFIKVFSNLNHVPDFWKSLGKTWVMDTLSFKYYSSCGYSQGPVNAVLQALGGRKARMEDIRSVHLHSPVLTVVMEAFSKPHHGSGLTPVNINFSTKRSASAAILFGSLDGNFWADGQDVQYHDRISALCEKVTIHHHWKHTIEMILGMDACLEHAGYPVLFDIGGSDSTLKYLKTAYQNRTIFHLSEFREFLRMPRGYARYLMLRAMKSYIARLGLTNRKSFESDLSKMKFRIGTTAEIIMNSGEVLKGFCDVPKGFAGDPDQAARVHEKYERECIPVWGEEKTKGMLLQVMSKGLPLIPSFLEQGDAHKY
jgi:2-methylcitrate dehydratase PrpD